jgi:hypothetical protein
MEFPSERLCIHEGCYGFEKWTMFNVTDQRSSPSFGKKLSGHQLTFIACKTASSSNHTLH